MTTLQGRIHGGARAIAVVFALVLVGLMAAPAAVGAAEPPEVTPTNVTTELGGVVAFDVTTGGATSVEVTIRADGGPYARNLTVRDADGDGRVRLRLNTHVANRTGNPSHAFSTTDAVAVDVTDAAGGDLGAGSYALRVAGDGESTGAATFTVTERSVENATILTAPERSKDRLTTRDAIAAARDDGRLAPTDAVATGDALVLRFESDGLAGALAAQDAATPTAQFRSLLDEPETSLQFYETNPSPMRDVKAVDVTGSGVRRLVVDDGTYYVFVELDEADVGVHSPESGFAESRHAGGIHAGDWWMTNVTIAGLRVVEPVDDEGAPTNFETADPSVSVAPSDEPERQLFVAEPNQSVAVETTLAPGSVVTVNATTPGGRLVESDELVVQRGDADDGDDTQTNHVAGTTLDFSDVEADPVRLTVRGRDATATTEHAVVEPPILTIREGATTRDSQVFVHNVTVPHGGYVALLRGTDPNMSRQDGLLGHSDYLEPGKHRYVHVEVDDSNVTEPLTAALYYSEDRSFDAVSEPLRTDRTYLVSGSAVLHSQPPSTEIPAVTTTRSTSTPAATTEPGTNATGPGLTAVAALVGVLVFGLLATRRR